MVPDADAELTPSVPVQTQLMATTTLGSPVLKGSTMNCGKDHVNFAIFPHTIVQAAPASIVTTTPASIVTGPAVIAFLLDANV